MSNRVHYFIQKFLQNSKQNREKFVKNKKIYNEYIVKSRLPNHNKIIKRGISTYSGGDGGSGGNNGGGNDYLLMGITAVGVYISTQISKKK
jgi:hypothetical protein